jgi:hypothetical protein
LVQVEHLQRQDWVATVILLVIQLCLAGAALQVRLDEAAHILEMAVDMVVTQV